VLTADHLRAVLLAWRNKAVRLRTLNRTVEVSLIQRQEQLLATAFGRWRDAYRERTLAGVEQEVALRSEDALLFAVWDRWKERSTVRWRSGAL
jgi:protein SFI1